MICDMICERYSFYSHLEILKSIWRNYGLYCMNGDNMLACVILVSWLIDNTTSNYDIAEYRRALLAG